MAKRSYSINDVYSWKFHKQEFPKAFADLLGSIPDRFMMYVDGEAGEGKTEFMLQLALMLACHMGKVRLNNVEQGKHSQIQESFVRNKFREAIPAGRFQYDSIRDFEEFKAKLARPNSGRIIIIDSISYWPLNQKQIQELIDTFKNKSFVFVAYRADFNKNKAIRHLCDIKINVNNYFAQMEGGRFGGYKDYDIWPDKHRKITLPQQPTLFEGREVAHG